MHSVALASLKTGITRLRSKGGADPKSLYDLVNGYVDASGAPVARAGTSMDYTLPAGTKGLCAFEGKLHVFATEPVTSTNPLYVVDVIRHPDPEFTGTIAEIHFAKPFLGYLYVVAEFSDGGVYHFWLQSPDPWAADKQYADGALVQPTTPTGYYYKAGSNHLPPTWKPDTPYKLGDTVQPTKGNGWKYTVVEVDGSSPTSGDTEPDWPTTDGAQVDEDVTGGNIGKTPPPPAPSEPPPPVRDRYGNLPGSVPGRYANKYTEIQ